MKNFNALRWTILLISLAFAANFLQAAVTIDPPTRTFAKEGGGASILTSGSGSWTASTAAGWITITPRTSGVAGESCIYIVSANFSADTRQGEILVADQTHTVTQTGYPSTLSPTSASYDRSGGGGSINITVDAGVSWTALSNVGWIQVSPNSGLSTGSVSYTVEPYAGVVSRSGSMTIAGRTFSVTQTGADVNLDPESVQKEYSSDIIIVNVTALATTSWTVIPNAGWISIVDDGNGFGDSAVTLAVGTNPSYLERTGTVSIGSATLTVTQAGTPNPVLDILPKEATAEPVGAFGNVAVLATPDAPWSAESLDPWIVISEGNAGTGNGNIGYVVSANPNLTERVGQIKVNAPVYVPTIDLTKSLMARVWTLGDESGWRRNFNSLIDSTFNGTFYRTWLGPTIAENDNSATMMFKFTHSNPGTINRMMRSRSADSSKLFSLYLNTSDRLVFHARQGVEDFIVESTYPLQSGQYYSIALSCSEQNDVRIFIGPENGELEQIISTQLPFAPFDLSEPYNPNYLLLGYSELPSIGYLQGARFWDFRFYARELPLQEIQAASDASPWYGGLDTSGTPQPRVRFNARGQWLVTGGTSNNVGIADRGIHGPTEWDAQAQDRFGIEGRALKHGVDSGNYLYVVGNIDSIGNHDSASYNLWIKFNQLGGTALVHDRNTGLASNDLGVTALTDGRLQISGPINYTTATPVIRTGEWHMLTVTGVLNGTAKFYVDGAEVGNAPAGGYYFGVEPNRQFAFYTGQGLQTIDQFEYYAGVLTSPQVQAIYDEQKPPVLYHTITQGVFDASINPSEATIPAAGGSASSELSIPANVNWTASTGESWITITSATSGAGPATLEVLVEANPTVYERIGTVTVAGNTFTITQSGLGVSLQYADLVFATDGGSAWIDVFPEGNALWEAISNVSWITVAIGETGLGSGSVFIVADPYTQTSQSRTGSLTIAGQTVYVTQRGYQLSVSPEVAQIGSNAGAGEFGVAAPIGAIWEAIATSPWITINGGTSGVGNGTIRYSVEENNTGATRTGRIIVSGAEYTITQTSSLIVTIEATTDGSASGGGAYTTNATAVLTAFPDPGYVFSHWTGDAVGSENPLNLLVDTDKTVQAVFIPEDAAVSIAETAVQEVIADPNPYGLYTETQIRSMAMGQPVIKKDPSTGQMALSFGLKRSINLLDWEPVSILPEDTFIQDGKLEVEVTPEGDTEFYTISVDAAQ